MPKSIVEKLNLRKYANKLLINPPKSPAYFDDLFAVPNDSSLPLDLLFIFVYSLDELVTQIKRFTQDSSFNKQGYLFVAYPKLSNPLNYKGIHRDMIFPALNIDPEGDGYLENTDFKFSRMVSLDQTFTIVGLKYLPKSDKVKTVSKSQRITDYQDRLPELIVALTDQPDILQFFTSLTPGYQKGWARYIYSAKLPQTQTSRLAETIDILRQGFKSKDLYKKNKPS